MNAKTTPILEVVLSLTVFGGMVVAGIFFKTHGYLPEPFFQDIDDTFMDWFNTAYWAHNPGAYSIWGTVYPPISFDFLKLVSLPSCYAQAGTTTRDCDWPGRWVLAVFVGLNVVLTFVAYRRSDPSTAVPRAFAVALGMPMLFGWERGNLVVPCFTAFALGYGRLLRSAWLRWVCVAVALNFKPYLLVTLGAPFLKQRWRWLEGAGLALIGVYALSYIPLGEGDPLQLVHNIVAFAQPLDYITLSSIDFTTSYNSLLAALGSTLPLMRFVGSRPIELLQVILPMAIRLAEVGGLACFAGAVLRPKALSNQRLACLLMTLLLVVYSPGGYASVFFLFLLFLEPRRGAGLTVAMVAGYLLCVPWDMAVANIGHGAADSYLSGLSVDKAISLTLGEVVRPALVLIVEYGLVWASLSDLLRDWREEPRPDRPAARPEALDQGQQPGVLQ